MYNNKIAITKNIIIVLLIFITSTNKSYVNVYFVAISTLCILHCHCSLLCNPKNNTLETYGKWANLSTLIISSRLLVLLIDDVLMMYWWCIDDVLMMYWWCIDVLMMYWWCIDDIWWSIHSFIIFFARVFLSFLIQDPKKFCSMSIICQSMSISSLISCIRTKMLRTLIRRDGISRHSLKVSLSSKADPDQKLRDNVRYHSLLLLLSLLQYHHTITTTITPSLLQLPSLVQLSSSSPSSLVLLKLLLLLLLQLLEY